MPHQPPPSPHAPATTLLPKPPWIDGDILFRTLSPDHQRTVVALLQPIYDHLVLQPHDPFEQLTGNGLVYLLWDELLRQCQIGSMQNVPFADQTDRSRHMTELLRSPNRNVRASHGHGCSQSAVWQRL